MVWAAAGFKDTLSKWKLKLEVGHGNKTAIQLGKRVMSTRRYGLRDAHLLNAAGGSMPCQAGSCPWINVEPDHET